MKTKTDAPHIFCRSCNQVVPLEIKTRSTVNYNDESEIEDSDFITDSITYIHVYVLCSVCQKTIFRQILTQNFGGVDEPYSGKKMDGKELEEKIKEMESVMEDALCELKSYIKDFDVILVQSGLIEQIKVQQNMLEKYVNKYGHIEEEKYEN